MIAFGAVEANGVFTSSRCCTPAASFFDRIELTIKGRGGHASLPHVAVDPIPVACEMVSALQAMSPGDWRWLTAAGLWLVLQGGLIHYLGDDARYLSPRPGNIRLRRAIRADGDRLSMNGQAQGDLSFTGWLGEANRTMNMNRVMREFMADALEMRP